MRAGWSPKRRMSSAAGARQRRRGARGQQRAVVERKLQQRQRQRHGRLRKQQQVLAPLREYKQHEHEVNGGGRHGGGRNWSARHGHMARPPHNARRHCAGSGQKRRVAGERVCDVRLLCQGLSAVLKAAAPQPVSMSRDTWSAQRIGQQAARTLSHRSACSARTDMSALRLFAPVPPRPSQVCPSLNIRLPRGRSTRRACGKKCALLRLQKNRAALQLRSCSPW